MSFLFDDTKVVIFLLLNKLNHKIVAFPHYLDNLFFIKVVI